MEMSPNLRDYGSLVLRRIAILQHLVERLLLVLAFLITATVQCGYAQVHSPYRMIDSGFPAEDFYPTAWVDNDRVIFTGVKLGTYLCDVKDSRHCGGRGHLLAVSTWHVSQNKVTSYKDRILSDLCVHNGYISYKAREQLSDQEGSVFAGEFGKEKKLGPMSEYRYMNPVSCRYYNRPPKPIAEGRRASLLLEEHGYVDFGRDLPAKLTPEERNAPPVLRSLDGKKAVPLDIEKRYLENRLMDFKYVRFSNEYFSRADTIDHSILAPAFYVTPEGKVRKVEFSERRQLGGTYHPTRLGVLLTTDGDRKADSGGGYLLAPSRLTKIVSGSLRRASVSPNGCKIAFVYAASWDAVSQGYRAWKEGKPGNTIRMIDLCEG